MRFAFITDTHIGGDNSGWHRQPRWAGDPSILFDRLKRILDDHLIEVLVHAGDITEHGTRDEIELSLDLLDRLKIPVISCLGNHDMMAGANLWPAAVERRRDFFPADTIVRWTDCDFVAVNNHWIRDGKPQMFWSPSFNPDPSIEWQLEWLDEKLSTTPERPAVVVVHAPIDALPPDLTGKSESVRESSDAYCESLQLVLDNHPRVRLLLSGHCHVNHIARHSNRIQLTSTAFNEVPFMVRLIDMNANGNVSIQTISLREDSDPIDIDQAAAWVTGRASDRSA